MKRLSDSFLVECVVIAASQRNSVFSGTGYIGCLKLVWACIQWWQRAGGAFGAPRWMCRSRNVLPGINCLIRVLNSFSFSVIWSSADLWWILLVKPPFVYVERRGKVEWSCIGVSRCAPKLWLFLGVYLLLTQGGIKCNSPGRMPLYIHNVTLVPVKELKKCSVVVLFLNEARQKMEPKTNIIL